MFPGRPADAFGTGLTWTWLNRDYTAGRDFDFNVESPIQLALSSS
ncbi:hypothetical protein [Paludisphaera rhizosphaerae]|nr:hypothetical protein [Paludisphaera rhizosphaerae]